MANIIRQPSKLWKCTIAILAVVFVLTSFKQSADEKIWNAKSLLTWNDYLKPEKDKKLGAQAKAYTNIAISFRYIRLKKSSDVFAFAFQVKNTMYRNKSWVDPAYVSTGLLVHEQLHFDISEYFSRQLLQALESYTFSNNYKDEMSAIVERNTTQYKAMSDLYDAQGDHSNKVMQSKWNAYVSSLLRSNEKIDQALKRLP